MSLPRPRLRQTPLDLTPPRDLVSSVVYIAAVSISLACTAHLMHSVLSVVCMHQCTLYISLYIVKSTCVLVVFSLADILVTTPNRLVHMLSQEPPTIKLNKSVCLCVCVCVCVCVCSHVNPLHQEHRMARVALWHSLISVCMHIPGGKVRANTLNFAVFRRYSASLRVNLASFSRAFSPFLARIPSERV